MKSIKIAVLTKNKRYGEALARGLAEESSGIEIACVDSIERGKYDIIMTDCDGLSGPEILILSDKKGETGGKHYKTFPVKKILEIIIAKYMENTGQKIIPQGICNTYIIGTGSKTGGSGTTSVAITMGRSLALSLEKKVVFLDCTGTNDYRIYSECNFDNSKTIRELIFRIKYDRKVHISEYLSEDCFGLHMFRQESAINKEDINEVILYLCETGFADVIVIDAGKNTELLDVCHKKWLINNEKDKRCLNNTDIINFSEIPGQNRIRFDENSFIRKGEKVDISIEGAFSKDIDDILSELTERAFVE